MAAVKPPSFKVILGSKSVARRNILAEMGYQFAVMTADINEKGIRRENPEELVMVLAEAKDLKTRQLLGSGCEAGGLYQL